MMNRFDNVTRVSRLVVLIAIAVMAACVCGCGGNLGQGDGDRVGRLEQSVADLGGQVAALRADVAAMRGEGAITPTSASRVGETRSSGGVKITRISENVNLVEGVTGQGLSAKAAMSDAQRRAVEAGAQTYIDSQSRTEDFELIRDTIYARSAGFIEDLEKLSESAAPDGVYTVKINARVSISGIENFWGATRALLDQLGNPKIVVWVEETIGGNPQASSAVQTRIEGLLIKSGFLLADKKQLARIMAGRPASETYKAANELGAQLTIVGSANAAADTPASTGGVLLYKYEAVGSLRCYRSDTGRLISSQAGRARGVATVSEAAAKQALAGVADDVATQIQTDILYHWKEVLEKSSKKP